MKKTILIICLTFLCFTKNVLAKEINIDDYELEITGISFEIYDEDNLMCENNGYYKMYCNSTYTEDINLDEINDEIKEEQWLLEREIDVNIIDLNIDTSDFLNKFRDTKPSNSKNYAAVIMVNYKYKSIPNDLNTIYHTNYYEVLLNSFYGALSGNEYQLEKTELNETIRVPIWFAAYTNETGEYEEYSNLTDLQEASNEEILLLLNFDAISESISEYYNNDENAYYENNWIVNYDDTDIIANYFLDMNRPVISKDISRDDFTKTYIQLDSTYDSESTCYIYRSNSEYANYKKIGESKCGDLFVDNDIEPSTIYYYKVLDTKNNLYSNILKVETINFVSNDKIDSSVDDADINNKENENKQEQNNNKKENNDNKITGTTESEKLGLSNNLIVLFGFVIIGIAINFKGKNYLKRRI